jgi:hypothetical protein
MKLLNYIVVLQIFLLPFAAAVPPLISGVAQQSIIKTFIDALGMAGEAISTVKSVYEYFFVPKNAPINYSSQLSEISSKVRILKK